MVLRKKINKIFKPLRTLTKKIKGRLPIWELNKGFLYIPVEIKRIREYYQLYMHKFDNLDKKDQFLEKTQSITTHSVWNRFLIDS